MTTRARVRRREEQIKSKENSGELHATFQGFCQLQVHYFSHISYVHYLHRSMKIISASLTCFILKIELFYRPGLHFESKECRAHQSRFGTDLHISQLISPERSGTSNSLKLSIYRINVLFYYFFPDQPRGKSFKDKSNLRTYVFFNLQMKLFYHHSMSRVAAEHFAVLK